MENLKLTADVETAFVKMCVELYNTVFSDYINEFKEKSPENFFSTRISENSVYGHFIEEILVCKLNGGDIDSKIQNLIDRDCKNNWQGYIEMLFTLRIITELVEYAKNKSTEFPDRFFDLEKEKYRFEGWMYKLSNNRGEYIEVTDNIVEIDGKVENGVLHTSGTVTDGVLSL